MRHSRRRSWMMWGAALIVAHALWAGTSVAAAADEAWLNSRAFSGTVWKWRPDTMGATRYVVGGVGTPDQYEPDNTADDAGWIGLDAIQDQTHNFHEGGDEDWVIFYGETGEVITAETLNLGSNCDTYLELFEADGTTLLAENDDRGPWLLWYGASYIAWTVQHDGFYLVRVTEAVPAPNYDTGTEYDLRVERPTAPTASATLTVAVKNALTAAIPGATVTLRSFTPFWTLSQLTGLSGSRIFGGLNTGGYSLWVSAPGYLDSSIFSMTLLSGAQSQTITLLLDPPVLSVSPESSNPAPQADSLNIEIENTGPGVMSWQGLVVTGGTWLQLDAPSFGSGDGTLTASFSANYSQAARVGTVQISATGATNEPATNSPRTVTITQQGDTEAPLVFLEGTNPTTVQFGSTYVDAGATAVDGLEGNLTARLAQTYNDVNTSAVGTYSVTWSVLDTAGNQGSATRTVHVVDEVAPTITVLGNNPASVEQHAAYFDAGANATDNADGDISAGVQTTGSVDTSTLGAYTLYYNVSDSSGNPAAQKSRTVNVVATTPTEEVVGSSGGSVSRDGILVVILPGALAGDTTITIDRADPGTPTLPDDIVALIDGTTFVVDPAGQTAQGGGDLATVTIWYPDADQDGYIDGTTYHEDHLAIFRTDQSGGNPIALQGAVDPDANTITVTTECFSLFTVAAGDSGLSLSPWVLLALLGVALLGGGLLLMRRHPFPGP